MPKPESIEEFLGFVRRSELLEPATLEAAIAALRREKNPPDTPKRWARALVNMGLLTFFQAQELLDGRYRNFFVGGKYKVLERIGAGGMAAVFLCEHRVMRRLVALKVLPDDWADKPQALARFHREARAVAQLQHPNIVGAFDVDQASSVHYIVMEFVDGNDLEGVVRLGGPLAVNRACEYVRQAAEGLQHAHDAGLVHRDVKPANILVDRAGTVKVLDLGLARFAREEHDGLTKQGDVHALLGTYDYLAPEQILDSHDVDVRADIYGLGGSFYYLLTGRSPFQDGSTIQKLAWSRTRDPDPIRDFRPDVPDGVVAVLEKMMAKEPADRYQEPRAVAEALAPFAAGAEVVPTEAELPRLSPAARKASLSGVTRPPTPRPAVAPSTNGRPKAAAPTPAPKPAPAPASGRSSTASRPVPPPSTSAGPGPAAAKGSSSGSTRRPASKAPLKTFDESPASRPAPPPPSASPRANAVPATRPVRIPAWVEEADVLPAPAPLPRVGGPATFGRTRTVRTVSTRSRLNTKSALVIAGASFLILGGVSGGWLAMTASANKANDDSPAASTGRDAGNLDSMAADLAHRLSLLNDDPVAWSERAGVDYQVVRSEGLFDRVVKLRPDDSQLYVARARYRARTGKLKEALLDYEQVFEKKPMGDNATEYACALLLLGDHERYAKFCERVGQRADAGSDTFGYYIAARVTSLAPAEGVDPERAIRWAEQALAKDQGSAHFHHVLGLALYRAGRLDQAAERIQKSIEITPGWQGVGQNWAVMAMIRIKQKNAEEAKGWLARTDAPLGTSYDGPRSIPPADWLEMKVLRGEADALLIKP
ncbi:MAG TPA: protein kinase [Isosphaeraceae bacterium]|jgi:serine/threonine protein kinase|nr:protein kinase [Isosphaeraceae bacterium]